MHSHCARPAWQCNLNFISVANSNSRAAPRQPIAEQQIQQPTRGVPLSPTWALPGLAATDGPSPSLLHSQGQGRLATSRRMIKFDLKTSCKTVFGLLLSRRHRLRAEASEPLGPREAPIPAPARGVRRGSTPRHASAHRTPRSAPAQVTGTGTGTGTRMALVNVGGSAEGRAWEGGGGIRRGRVGG